MAAGLQEPYERLRPPIDWLAFLRPTIAVLYLVIAARFFMAAVPSRQRVTVFATVLLAAFLATAVNIVALKAYFEWNYRNSSCMDKVMAHFGIDRAVEWRLKQMAAELNATTSQRFADWEISFRAEGRDFFQEYRARQTLSDMDAFRRSVAKIEKDELEEYCSSDGAYVFRVGKATWRTIFFSVDGERLTSFSIGPADCPQW